MPGSDTPSGAQPAAGGATSASPAGSSVDAEKPTQSDRTDMSEDVEGVEGDDIGADDVGGDGEESPWGDPDRFEWDKWDGRAYDSFPEPVRNWAQRLSDWHQQQFEQQSDEVRRLREVYQAILDGNEDPRVAELTDRYKQLETDHKSKQAELDAILRWVNEQENARVQKEIDAWEKGNKWLFDDDVYRTAAQKLADEGWPLVGIEALNGLAELVKLPESVRKAAIATYQKTKDVDIALRLARAEAGTFKAKKPTTADFVSGADSPTVSSSHTDTNDKTLPFEERKVAAARKALRRAQRS